MGQGKQRRGRIFQPGDFCKGDRYKIFDCLGAGGMGEVWTAFDTQAEDYEHQWVAVKVLQSSLAFDEDSKARLVCEASALLPLQHPNLVRVLHFDVDDERNLFFYVMELLKGETLDARIKRTGGLDVDEALGIYADVLDGVHVLHCLGIIHRDLKPENIFVAEDGRAVVLDLGVAKFDPQRFPDRAQPTGPGIILGTCAYMSPEQCLGEALDARSDLYAVGLIAYAGLAGVHPARVSHGGEIPHEYKQWAGWHLHQRPRPLVELLPWLDAEVWEVIAVALEKERHQRFSSAEEMSVLVQQVRASQKAKGRRRPPPAGPMGAAKPGKVEPAALLPLATTKESEVRSSPAPAAPVPVRATAVLAPAPRAVPARPAVGAAPEAAGPGPGSPVVGGGPRAPAGAGAGRPARREEPAALPVRTAAGTEIIALDAAPVGPRTAQGTEIIRVEPPPAGPGPAPAATGRPETAKLPAPSRVRPRLAAKVAARSSESGASQRTAVAHDVPSPESSRAAPTVRVRRPFSRGLVRVAIGAGIGAVLGVAVLRVVSPAGPARPPPAVAGVASAVPSSAPVLSAAPEVPAPAGGATEPPAGSVQPAGSAEPPAGPAGGPPVGVTGAASASPEAAPISKPKAAAPASKAKPPAAPSVVSPGAPSAAPAAAPPVDPCRRRLPSQPCKPVQKSDRIVD